MLWKISCGWPRNDTSLILTGGVSSVGENGLTGDPLAIGAEEADQRGDVLHHRQSVAHGVALVELDRLRRLLWVEEGCTLLACGHECKCYEKPTRIHRPGGHIVHAHTPRLQFLADTSGEVLHWRFRSSI